MINVFTDGSCGKEFDGAFAICIVNGKSITEFTSKCYENTTNNQMELSAITTALKILSGNNLSSNDEVTIYSDSEYCVKSINLWLNTWIKNNYNIGKKSEIKNIPFWEQFVKVRDSIKFKVKFEWVKGHSNNEFNNICDKNAVRARINKAETSVVNTYEKE